MNKSSKSEFIRIKLSLYLIFLMDHYFFYFAIGIESLWLANKKGHNANSLIKMKTSCTKSMEEYILFFIEKKKKKEMVSKYRN